MKRIPVRRFPYHSDAVRVKRHNRKKAITFTSTQIAECPRRSLSDTQVTVRKASQKNWEKLLHVLGYIWSARIQRLHTVQED